MEVCASVGVGDGALIALDHLPRVVPKLEDTVREGRHSTAAQLCTGGRGQHLLEGMGVWLLIVQ